MKIQSVSSARKSTLTFKKRGLYIHLFQKKDIITSLTDIYLLLNILISIISDVEISILFGLYHSTLRILLINQVKLMERAFNLKQAVKCA